MRWGRTPWRSGGRAGFNSDGGETGRGHRTRNRIAGFRGNPMAYAIPLWTPPALPIAGSNDQFPVRRIFCVGRNYAEHQKEMGGDGRETPFFLLKSEFAVVVRGGPVHYPAKSYNYHYEPALFVAL